MATCLLQLCKEPAQGGALRFSDFCTKHAGEAAAFYASIEDTGLMGVGDPGSDHKGTPLDEKAMHEIKVEQKQEFAERCTLEKVRNLETLKLSSPALKDYLRDSFTSWLKLGCPLSKTDPFTLTVEVCNFRMDVLRRVFRTTDLDAQLELMQVKKLNELLFDLPLLFEEVQDALLPKLPTTHTTKRKSARVVGGRHVRVTLSWWGTVGQSSLADVLTKPTQVNLYQKQGNTLKPIH